MSQNVAGARQPPLMDQMARQVSRWWWVPLVAGLLSIVLGLAILASPWTVKALVVVTGLLFVVHGVSLVLSPAYAGDSRGEQVLAGILAVIAGIVLLAWPGPTLLLLAVFAGAWLAVSGGFNIVTSIARRHILPYWGLTTAVGGIELVLGLWAMRRPEVTLSIVVVAIGLWAVITGVLYCVLAFEVRRIARAVTAAAGAPGGGTAGAGTAAGGLDPALERIDRLYAEGHLSEADHARLTDALRSSGPAVPSMSSGSPPASGSAPASPSTPRSAPPRSA
jgi:uncharacterized membrane protein HdeD (DUF308 family)